MIVPFRSAVARCLPRYVRPLSTADMSNDQIALKEAYDALEMDPPTTDAAATPSRSTSASNFMNIPPAEDPLLHYFTSRITQHGHRARAARITAQTLLYIHAFTRAPPLPIFQQAIFDAAPAVRTLMHRQGGKTNAKPVALGEKQRTQFAISAILKASKNRPGQTLQERLARELIAIVQGDSQALKEKQKIHQFAMVNRGNAKARI